MMIMKEQWRQCVAPGLAGLLLCLALIPAQANPGGSGSDMRAARMQQKEERRAARAALQEQREAHKGDLRPDAPRKGGRLTPEERRDLRRQINEAGQDLYQNAPKN